MLYVGCSVCHNVGPLLCAGNFPLHTVLPAMPGPMGARCPYCGPMLPSYACWRCGSRQSMFFPATQTTSPQLSPVAPGGPPRLAPVIQAEAGLNAEQLTSLFGKAITQFCTSAGGQLAPDLVGALRVWTDGFQGAWQ